MGFFSKHAKLITTAIKKNIKNKTKNLMNNYIHPANMYVYFIILIN